MNPDLRDRLDHQDPVEARLREAGSRPVPARPLDDILVKARSIRRRRTAARSVGTSALVAAAVAGVVLAVPALQGAAPDVAPSTNATETAASTEPTAAPKRSADAERTGHPERAGTLQAPGCTTGYGYIGAFTDVPDLLYLPSKSVAGRPSSTLVRLDRSDCEPEPLAAVATRSVDGVVRSSVMVTGPDAVDHYAAGEDGETFDGSVVRVTGVPGRLDAYLMTGATDGDRTLISAHWRDPEGRTWAFTPRGLSTEQLGELVSGLRTAGGTLDPGSFPEAYQVAGADDLIQPTRDRWSLRATFPPVDGSGERTVHVERGQNIVAQAAAWPGAAPFDVEVLGRPRSALWSAGKEGMLVVDLGDGVVVSVTGDPDRTRATRLVESLRKVDPDDPRLIVEDRPRDVPTD